MMCYEELHRKLFRLLFIEKNFMEHFSKIYDVHYRELICMFLDTFSFDYHVGITKSLKEEYHKVSLSLIFYDKHDKTRPWNSLMFILTLEMHDIDELSELDSDKFNSKFSKFFFLSSEKFFKNRPKKPTKEVLKHIIRSVPCKYSIYKNYENERLLPKFISRLVGNNKEKETMS